jgi:hypothetical protein
MTDQYPPFRLDMGGPDSGTLPVRTTPPSPSGAPVAGPLPQAWTAGRIVALVFGALLLFAAAGTMIGGGTLLWADQDQREDGYLWSPTAQVGTDSYAITSDSFRLEGAGLDWGVDEILGRARIEVTPADPDTDVFVGIARTSDAAGYLETVGYTRLDDLSFGWEDGRIAASRTTEHAGEAPDQPPGQADIWVAQSSGAGTHDLTWRPADGDWTVVVMRADGDAGVAAELRAGATAPGLPWIAGGMLAVGALLLAVGGLLVGLAARQAKTPPRNQSPAYGGPPAPRSPGAAETSSTAGVA